MKRDCKLHRAFLAFVPLMWIGIAQASYLPTSLGGNLGIGTTQPGAKLQVGPGVSLLGADLSTDSVLVKGNLEVDGKLYGSASHLIQLNIVGGVSGLTAGSVLRATSSSSIGNGILFDTGFNVGIGTTTPQASLELVKSATAPLLRLSSVAGANGDYLTVLSNGNVGIGTTVPVSPFQVKSGVTDAITFTTNNTTIDASTTSLKFYVNGSGTPQVSIAPSGDVAFSTSANIPKLSNLTTNGFLKTSGANGTVGVGTTSADLAAVLSDETGTGQVVLNTAPAFSGHVTAARFNNQSLLNNYSTAAQSLVAATRTYITGSQLAIPTNKLQIGTMFRWTFDVTKTAAVTGITTIDIAFGTNGTTADTARVSFTKPGGNGAADCGRFVIEAVVRGPLSGAGIVAGHMGMTHNLQTTGLAVIPFIDVTTVSGAFDVTTPTYVGVCITSGGADAFTIQTVTAETWNL